MNLKKYLRERSELIDEQLNVYSPPLEGFSRNVRESVRYSLFAGGKRLRPIFTLAVLDLFGCPRQWGFPTACSLEMIHTSSLILDDLPCMDNASTRRGKPVNHIVFGEETALLAAMALLNQAHEVLADDRSGGHISEKNRWGIVKTVSKAIGTEGIIGGQAVDLASVGKQLDFEMLLYIHSRKTTPLFSAALEVGGIIAGADSTAMHQLRRYGKNLGLAFQITDDILDVTGKLDELGKDTHSDASRTTFASYLGVTASRQLAEELIASAIAAAESLGKGAGVLVEIASFIIFRKF